MCLGVPGRIERIWDAGGTLMSEVDFGGVRKEVCLAYLPEAVVGDWTIVHVGFAITRLDEQSARESLELFRSIGLLDDELQVIDPSVMADDAAAAPGATSA